MDNAEKIPICKDIKAGMGCTKSSQCKRQPVPATDWMYDKYHQKKRERAVFLNSYFLRKLSPMYLINWLHANLMMVFVLLVLIGLPAVIIYVSFRKYDGIDANKEEYLKKKAEENK